MCKEHIIPQVNQGQQNIHKEEIAGQGHSKNFASAL
jgi:hypothetical protein